MKYVMLLIVISGLLYACGQGAGETAKSDSANATQAINNTGGTSNDTAENTTAINLIASNDCLTCHKIDEQAFGPSYKQIANKYEMNQGNIENLAGRIRHGAKGLWGQNAMTPHPNVSDEQAQEMARYILSLRDTTATK